MTYQRILTSSINARLLAIRQVTSNNGKLTPGIDKKVLITDEDKMEAAHLLGMKPADYKASPVRRVYIPKTNGKMRPLGIPTIMDRAMQALYNLALSPIMEVKGDNNSFGFRKGRSTHDAVQCIYEKIGTKFGPKFILDADIQGFFDNVSHSWIMENVPLNPHVLKEFLKAGFLDEGSFQHTDLGVPQGGIISPTIANMILDGLEATVEESLKKADLMTAKYVTTVRYADDFMITAKHEWTLKRIIIPAVESFLKERGLNLNKTKTKIVHLTPLKGELNFLGFTMKMESWREDHAMFIRPDAGKVEDLKRKIKSLINKAGNWNSLDLVEKLNPILRGWAQYYKTSNSGKLFMELADLVWRAQLDWALKKMPGRSKRRVVDTFFTRINGALHFVGKRKNITKKGYRLESTKIVYHKVRRPELFSKTKKKITEK